ncbi:hypothetical protein [Histidinibacterium aquaticum]|uniref:PepSY domain-containing protein n=1 Tax=Histidinibacterium aquaticum TaxID=2613962 RepID=A0A5J5GCS6_9RHOB|nr:hypothetical protein [Histidinibacterium aquaticum]KAA9005234.1 hypothetical protein F3S47_18185 [Histidinibacterium aquaticum]
MPKLLTLALLLCGLGASAAAETCASRDSVVDRLAKGWGESRQSVGIAANNAVVELYASPETGTWTITVTRPGGPTCLVASGRDYEHLAEPLPNTDSPA